jgi:hypothetical protein
MATKLITLTFENAVGTKSTTIPVDSIALVFASNSDVTITFNDLQSNTWRTQVVSQTVNAIEALQCGMVSIGSPTLCNGAPWPNGEVLVNMNYLGAIYDNGSTTQVVVQYGTNPVNTFVTAKDASDIVDDAELQFETPA